MTCERLYFSLDRLTIFPCVCEPIVEMRQYFLGPVKRLHDGVSEGVKDEGIFMEKGVTVTWHLIFLNFAVPFLQDIQEEIEVFVVLIKFMFIELLKLKARVWFGLEK